VRRTTPTELNPRVYFTNAAFGILHAGYGHESHDNFAHFARAFGTSLIRYLLAAPSHSGPVQVFGWRARACGPGCRSRLRDQRPWRPWFSRLPCGLLQAYEEFTFLGVNLRDLDGERP